MEILFIYDRNTSYKILDNLKDKVVSGLDKKQAIANKIETLILPIVPLINFPNNANIENYRGLEYDYNIADYKTLPDISWEAFFPVNKNYSFQHSGSENDGTVYSEFLKDKMDTKTPFRMLVYNVRDKYGIGISAITSLFKNQGTSARDLISSPFEVIYDNYVFVREYKETTDKVGDINYSLTLSQCAGNGLNINWVDLALQTGGNIITKQALSRVGLI